MPRGLAIISSALFIWGIGEGLFWIYQPFYLTQLGADPVAIGFTLGAAGLVTLLTHAPAGHLSDSIGRKPMLVASWMLGLVSAMVMAFATEINMFIVGMLLYAVTGFVSSPLSSYATNARGTLSVARAFSITSASFNTGMILGTYAGGWIGEQFGLRTAFIIAAALFVPSTLIVFFLPAQPTDAPHEHQNTPLAPLLGNYPYQRLLGVGFLSLLALTLPIQFTPKFLQDVHQLDLQQIGLLGSIGSLGNTLLMVGFGGLAPRLGFLLASLSMAITTLLFWRGQSLALFGLAYLLQGGNRAARSMLMALIRPLVNPAGIGLAYGVAESALGAANMLAPVLAGLLYAQNPGLMYPVAFAAILITLFLFTRMPAHPEPAQ